MATTADIISRGWYRYYHITSFILLILRLTDIAFVLEEKANKHRTQE
jgi:hypothetical protein